MSDSTCVSECTSLDRKRCNVEAERCSFDAASNACKANCSLRTSADTCCEDGACSWAANACDVPRTAPGSSRLLLQHTAKVTAAAFNYDGTQVVTGDEHGIVSVWNAQGAGVSQGPSHSFSVAHPVVAVSFLASQSAAAATNVGDLLFNTFPSERVSSSYSTSQPIASADFTLNGDRVVVAPRGSTSPARIYPFPEPGTPVNLGPADTVRFSPDGTKVVAVVGPYGLLYSSTSGLKEAEFVTNGQLLRHVACISPDNLKMLVGDLTIRRPIPGGRLAPIVTLHSNKGLTSCSFSPLGSTVVTGLEGGALKIWDVETGQEMASLGPNRGEITATKFSPDGTKLLIAWSTREDNIVEVLDLTFNECLLPAFWSRRPTPTPTMRRTLMHNRLRTCTLAFHLTRESTLAHISTATPPITSPPT